MKWTRVLVAGAAIGLAALSLAQGGGQRRFGRGMMGGGGLMPVWMTMNRQDVQDDLKLTSDQKTKLDELRSDMRTKMQGMFQPGQPPSEESQKAMQAAMEDANLKAAAILTPDQAKRLTEIRVQMAGNRAVYDKDVAKTLGITAEQDSKLKALQQKMQDANRQIFENTQDWQERRELMQKNQDAMKAEIDKVLTDAQKAKLKEIGGSPFEQRDQPGRGFGGGGFGGG